MNTEQNPTTSVDSRPLPPCHLAFDENLQFPAKDLTSSCVKKANCLLQNDQQNIS